ncbi:MAG: CBS domain-containing protein, partial [Gammaproteobacteria bacterium]|nr:CBS domain-containing protein [Gammaproteobacteria bacterium]NIT64444.1 CBS domain-containing protein [Gammaproteobacteria bacterium]NIV21356.1 CBS domain-containing protein [Gammaproteobacteria bacterium]NIY33024.1 CBS domain-containing protein [Gammaproteobacteria bacterium]
GALLGMVTEKDMLRVLYEDAEMVRTVADIMTTSLRSFQADAPLADVCDCLLANHFRRVPILEGERLVGLISRADLMGTILEVAAEHVGRT